MAGASVKSVMDSKLRNFCLWIASLAGGFALLAFAFRQVEPLLLPSTIFVSGIAVILFFRILFSRYYRSGIDLGSLAMRGEDGWSFFHPKWGLFGERAGTKPLLWARALLVLGILPANFLQHLTGVKAGWLWFAAAFVVTLLSIMHGAIEAHRLNE
jgi:hypothetical protein